MFSFPPESKLDFIFSLGSFSTHGKVNKHKVMLEFNPHQEEVMSFTQTNDIQLLYHDAEKDDIIITRPQQMSTPGYCIKIPPLAMFSRFKAEI